MRTLTLDRARRIALTSLGLTRPRPDPATRRDVRHFRKVLDTVDIVQLDSVNVLARAHELPFWSRLGPHDRTARDRWLWHSREAFDGWAHMASMTSVEVWPLLHYRRQRMGESQHAERLASEYPGYLEKVYAEVAERGPLSVSDLSEPGTRDGPWWGHPPGKVALDHLMVRGDLAIDHRTPTFLTVYDLVERVIPEAALNAETPDPDETHRRLLLRAARAHGIGTAADLADHHRLTPTRARPRLAELVEQGHLEEVRVREWGNEPVFVHPEARAARRSAARTLLSPFDPVVWFRPRAERLFDFHYRIEIYVPAAKRVYGYYVLPFLLGDRIVARVDLKADRAAGKLLVRGAFAEDGVDRQHVANELAAELTELGAWLDVPEPVIERNGDLAEWLVSALR